MQILISYQALTYFEACKCRCKLLASVGLIAIETMVGVSVILVVLRTVTEKQHLLVSEELIFDIDIFQLSRPFVNCYTVAFRTV